MILVRGLREGCHIQRGRDTPEQVAQEISGKASPRSHKTEPSVVRAELAVMMRLPGPVRP